MKEANSKNFISMLSEDKPVMCFFHYKAEESQVKKIKEIVTSIQKKLPLLPAYEYIIDENPENQLLCDVMEVSSTPVLIFYKNGCFNRYKDKQFSEASVMQFVGSKKQYMLDEEKDKEKKKIDVDVS